MIRFDPIRLDAIRAVKIRPDPMRLKFGSLTLKTAFYTLGGIMKLGSGIRQRVIQLDIEAPDIQAIIVETKTKESNNRLENQLREIRQSIEGIDRTKIIIEKAEVDLDKKFDILQSATDKLLEERDRISRERKQKKLDEWKKLTGRA